MQRFQSLARELAEDDEGVSLLAMLLDDTYHEWMHHPPKLEAVGTKAKRKESKPRRRRSGSQRGRSGGQGRSSGSGRQRNRSRGGNKKKQ
jgi:hypothetical protein